MVEGSRWSTGYCRGIILTSFRQIRSENLVLRPDLLGEREDLSCHIWWWYLFGSELDFQYNKSRWDKTPTEGAKECHQIIKPTKQKLHFHEKTFQIVQKKVLMLSWGIFFQTCPYRSILQKCNGNTFGAFTQCHVTLFVSFRFYGG